MIIEKDGKQIKVTKKAYRVVYKDLGFKEVQHGETEQGNTEGHEVETEQEHEGQETEEQSEKPFEEMTVPELKEEAKALGIEGYTSMKKEELLAEIVG